MAKFETNVSQIPRLPLLHAGPDLSIPQIGLGTAFIHDISSVVPVAVSVGYRVFDSAVMYGNESEIGQSLEKVFIFIRLNVIILILLIYFYLFIISFLLIY